MTATELKKIAPAAKTTNCNIYAPLLTSAMEKNGIVTKLRRCHFIAQLLHESGSLTYTREIASGKAYDGRKDLGNVQPGDGVRFKGRGLIQVTGRANYTQLGNDMGIDCVAHPELLEQPEYAVLSAVWYWNKRNLNKWADADDIFTITRRINGGTNGLADRQNFFNRAKKILT